MTRYSVDRNIGLRMRSARVGCCWRTSAVVECADAWWRADTEADPTSRSTLHRSTRTAALSTSFAGQSAAVRNRWNDHPPPLVAGRPPHPPLSLSRLAPGRAALGGGGQHAGRGKIAKASKAGDRPPLRPARADSTYSCFTITQRTVTSERRGTLSFRGIVCFVNTPSKTV